MQARSIRRRREIAEAALRVFCANGYAPATMDEICVRAGCSKGGLYHHFRTKDGVLEAVVELLREDAPLLRTVDRCAESWGVPATQLARLLVEACAEATRNPRLAALVSDTLQAASLEGLSEVGSMVQFVVLTKQDEEIAERAA